MYTLEIILLPSLITLDRYSDKEIERQHFTSLAYPGVTKKRQQCLKQEIKAYFFLNFRVKNKRMVERVSYEIRKFPEKKSYEFF